MENEAPTKTIRLTSESMNKAEIIVELENMVAARLFSDRFWLADPETISAYHRKLMQMGLLEEVRAEPQTWRITPLGKELDVDLFQAFMGLWYEWEVPLILEEYGLINESEFNAILECTSDANAERLLSGYVKRAYFDYRKAAKLH
jgi:hypothetical protein